MDQFSWSPGCDDEVCGFGRQSKKARKAGSVNGFVLVQEKLQHDTLDCFILALQKYRELVGCVPAMFKVGGLSPRVTSPWGASLQGDVDAAFRRVPVDPEQQWACGVDVRVGDEVGTRVCSRSIILH